MAIKEINDTIFKTDVLDEKEKFVLVDFTAEWCGPCRMLKPVIESISDTFSDSLSVKSLDIDTNAQSAQTYNIASIPCCILFKDGQEIHRIIGYKSQSAFESDISKFIK